MLIKEKNNEKNMNNLEKETTPRTILNYKKNV